MKPVFVGARQLAQRLTALSMTRTLDHRELPLYGDGLDVCDRIPAALARPQCGFVEQGGFND